MGIRDTCRSRELQRALREKDFQKNVFSVEKISAENLSCFPDECILKQKSGNDAAYLNKCPHTLCLGPALERLWYAPRMDILSTWLHRGVQIPLHEYACCKPSTLNSMWRKPPYCFSRYRKTTCFTSETVSSSPTLLWASALMTWR